MPHRNLFVLMSVSVISLICYHKVQTNRYARTLVDAMDQVERRYLEPISQKELFEGAMHGMMGRLDEYSGFISPEILKEFHESLDQEFGGVGMEVTMDPKSQQITVVSPLFGAPAYEAGIRAGDRILRIDDQSTQGLSLKDAVYHMRGKPGEPVTLSVLHEGEEEPVEIAIVRAVIRVDTVLGDTRRSDGSWNLFLEGHDRIGYLRINTFAKETTEELRRALGRLVEQDMQGLILDLRDDPGGLLEAAIEVCNLFVDSGVIVTTRYRDGEIVTVFQADSKDTFDGFPIAVLVNQYSASASEILAACLQDHQRAVVVGQRTWGKGTVQEVIDLEDRRGAIKLTTASYWRPSEKNIHRVKDADEDDDWGVRPDEGCEVIVEGEELVRLRLWRRERDMYGAAGNGQKPAGDGEKPFVDRQLARAVETLEETARSK